MIITLNAMVELSQMKITFSMENIIMCDFVCWVAREVWYLYILNAVRCPKRTFAVTVGVASSVANDVLVRMMS